MIHLHEIKTGNWISTKMPGSLIEAHKVLDKNESGVFIANNKKSGNVLVKTEVGWTYEKAKINLLFPSGIKGIPLSVEILSSCGFQLKTPAFDVGIPGYFLESFVLTIPGVRNKFLFTDASGIVQIEFVHELQNLYFKQMKKELDIYIAAFNFQIMHI